MDLNYLLFRQQIERSKAVSASSAAAGTAHAELAALYENAIGQITNGRIVALASKGRQTQSALIE
jgi:hypothetical protein